MLKREACYFRLKKLVGLKEHGWNNRGPLVDLIQKTSSIGAPGFPWCQALVNFAWRLATGGVVLGKLGKDARVRGGEELAYGTAGVWYFYTWARARGWVVRTPQRYDFVCFSWSGNGYYGDHVGMVVRVLRVGPVMYLQTIEGNTNPVGSVSDPGNRNDGVYEKRRLISARKCAYVRVPGSLPIEVRVKRRRSLEAWIKVHQSRMGKRWVRKTVEWAEYRALGGK